MIGIGKFKTIGIAFINCIFNCISKLDQPDEIKTVDGNLEYLEILLQIFMFMVHFRLW